MSEQERWKLFFETGLPQAYTYLKGRERQGQKQPDSRERAKLGRGDS